MHVRNNKYRLKKARNLNEKIKNVVQNVECLKKNPPGVLLCRVRFPRGGADDASGACRQQAADLKLPAPDLFPWTAHHAPSFFGMDAVGVINNS